MNNLVTSTGQYVLDLHVEKEVEVDGVGMGVLNDGTAYLNARGLARMCGIDHTLILRLGEQWGGESEQPRTRKIRSALEQQGMYLDKPFIETVKDGTTHHAYPDIVCMAVLEYYAFEARQSDNETALRNYRLLARSSFRQFIYAKVGYDPNGGIPVAWKQFHDRVTAAYGGIPIGYFSVFKETADIIVELIRGGADVGIHFIPDISVGKSVVDSLDRTGVRWGARRADEIRSQLPGLLSAVGLQSTALVLLSGSCSARVPTLDAGVLPARKVEPVPQKQSAAGDAAILLRGDRRHHLSGRLKGTVMTEKRIKKAKLTDAERHKRFIDMAKETDADEDPEAFDRAFADVVTPPKTKG